MDKLETLIACLPDAPFKTNLVEEITALRAEVTRLTLELDEAGSNCSMYKQQVLMLTKERDELEISNAFAHGEWRAVKDQLAALTKERNALQDKLNAVVTVGIREREQLVAAQAREAKLREALTIIRKGCNQRDPAAVIAKEALALPADDSALQERLKEERERIAQWYNAEGQKMNNRRVVETIRGMK